MKPNQAPQPSKPADFTPTVAPSPHRVDRAALMRWQASARGAAACAQEQRMVEALLPEVFGRTVVQLGSWPAPVAGGWLESAQMPVKCVLETADSDESVPPDQALAGEPPRALCGDASLPLGKGQVDAVVLPHALEYARSPHRLLREVDRVLSPHGYVVIVGFNPLSAWGLRHRLGWRHAALPRGHRFLSVNRVSDWLALLDMDVLALTRFGSGFPWTPPARRAGHWNWRRVVGVAHDSYALVARKRTIPLTPRQSRWKSAEAELSGVSAARVSMLRNPAQRRCPERDA